MKNLVEIDPITVKDKNDVIKALRILERLGIVMMSEEKMNDYLADETKIVNNDYLVRNNHGVFMVQSHYIGTGISIENLEKQVNDIIEKYPDLCNRIIEIEEKRKNFDNEIKEKRKQFDHDINALNNEIQGVINGFPIVHLSEK